MRDLRRLPLYLLLKILLPIVLLTGCAPTPLQPPVADLPAYRGADAPAQTTDPRFHVDVMTLTPEIRQLLDRHINASGDWLRLQQLAALFQADQQFGLRYNAAVTFDAAETFRRREGNCLSLSILFVAAARHVGLDARFQDVELLPTWRQEGNVFVAERHINVAVVIRQKPVIVDFLVDPATETLAIRQIADSAMLAQFYNNVGVEHLAAGELGATYLFFQRAVTLAPQTSYLWTNLGVVLSHAGQVNDARQVYRHALQLNAADEVALSNLAALADGKSEVSAELLARVERLRNSNPFYHYWQAERLRAAGDGDGAITELRKAIRLKSDESSFHFALARLLLLQGEREQADLSLESARRLARDDETRQRYEDEYRELLRDQTPAMTVSLRTHR